MTTIKAGDELRAAAKLMRERAMAATPGPWERPLDTRHKNVVIAALPEGEQGSWISGTIPAEFASHSGITGRYAGQRERVSVVEANIWSIGGFTRKRSGRDLDYIASMNPVVALAVADWLDNEAAATELVAAEGPAIGLPTPAAVKLARAYLGKQIEAPAKVATTFTEQEG
jgi:hypothetical protein